jgi:hypothetical protein
LDHRDRLPFDQIIYQRLDALDAALSNCLATAELAGHAELLPDVSAAVRQIGDMQHLLATPPLAPYLLVLSQDPSSMTVQVVGEPKVTYAFQYSTNLGTWYEVSSPTTVTNLGTAILQRNGRSPWFVRGRVIP